MIGKLTGTLAGKRDGGFVIVDVQGVGYCVRVPVSFNYSDNSYVSLFIHTAVRDDAIDLYGFGSEDDLVFFRQLMTVSSVGPKTALSIMSVAEPSALKRAIAAGDAATLTKVFGIGKKSAERIVVELRDKLQLETGHNEGSVGADAEVIEALMALGYSAHECRAALKNIVGEGIKDRLGAALKQLGRRSTV